MLVMRPALTALAAMVPFGLPRPVALKALNTSQRRQG